MTRSRSRTAIAAAASAAIVAAGCGFGPGSSTEGEATLTVTRDYGAEPMRKATVSDPSESETVIRLLDREAEVETRYGGGFVQSIDGVKGAVEDGRSHDWFFYVNGVESEAGAAEVRVRAGDRIWWDHRDWTDAMRVPAVVGSWPEPFLQASAGADRVPVRVECAGERPPCEIVLDALADEGVTASIEKFGADGPAEALRLLAGPWDLIREDPAAALVDEGPAVSGVFSETPDAGLIAAVRHGEDPVTWLITGTDATAVDDAADALDTSNLADRYAIAVSGGEVTPLPSDRGESP